MSDAFKLDARLEADSLPLLDLPLCRVRLMNDSRYPWLILVPRREGLRELIDLAPHDRSRLTDEVDACTRVLRELTAADKMNVAALGNLVPMLHVHVIARYIGDDAWPGPVWGVHPPCPYPDANPDLAARVVEALSR